MKTTIKVLPLILAVFSLFACNDGSGDDNPQPDYLGISLQTSSHFQTIHHFGASDAWSCQFVGKHWPLSKREQMADLLFSQGFKSDGSPAGIGLTSWRFNIGAGSAAQGGNSHIGDEWRRAEGFLQPDSTYDWTAQQGQRWFMQAAKERGAEKFFGFVNSPPVAMTKNGKAYASGGSSTNLAGESFDDYARFLAKVITQLKTDDGIELDYISPFNEPQWDWDGSGQEGCPWQNAEIASVTKKLDAELTALNLDTQIELPEAAQINYLYQTGNKPGRGDQIDEFFGTGSTYYIGDLPHVAQSVAGHSYFTTWNTSTLINSRRELASKLEEYPGLEYAMSEYTLLENNEEVEGNGRDLGMSPALYMARVIHADLTEANANSWQWWLAVSPYNYKDGLVYIDFDKFNGTVFESKMLWTLGNYSRFIEPGMVRIGVKRSDNRTIEQTLGGVMVSSFIDLDSSKTVTVAINYGSTTIPVKIENEQGFINCIMYRTAGGQDNLRKIGTTKFDDVVTLPPRSVTTFVEE